MVLPIHTPGDVQARFGKGWIEGSNAALRGAFARFPAVRAFASASLRLTRGLRPMVLPIHTPGDMQARPRAYGWGGPHCSLPTRILYSAVLNHTTPISNPWAIRVSGGERNAGGLAVAGAACECAVPCRRASLNPSAVRFGPCREIRGVRAKRVSRISRQFRAEMKRGRMMRADAGPRFAYRPRGCQAPTHLPFSPQTARSYPYAAKKAVRFPHDVV